MTVTEVVQTKNPWLAQYERHASTLSAIAPNLRSLRQQAIDAFARRGLPTLKDEEWKYTNVASLAPASHALVTSRDGVVARSKVAPFLLEELSGPRLVFVDGHYRPTFSATERLPAHVRVESLAHALRTTPAVVEAHLGRYASPEAQPFVALNTAFFQDGAYVSLPPGCVFPAPIHLVHVASGATPARASHVRHLLVWGEGAQATVVESYVGLGDAPALTNAVTEIVAGANTVVDHYKLQHETEAATHIGTLQVWQDRATTFTSHVASVGGALVRNDINTEFHGEGGECTLNGLYLVHGRQHVDNHTKIDHRVPHCTSHELYKGILDGESRGIFYGKVFIRKDAQKSSADQTNKNLVLSDNALVNSTPALEIYADDIKASHGSTTGQLDKNALFYLQSRGLDAATARSLLTYAFARDVVQRIRPEPVRAKLEALLFERLPHGQAVKNAL